MSGAGYFSEDFDIQAGLGLGDLLDADGDSGEGGNGGPPPIDNGTPRPPGVKQVKEKFPAIDGDISAAKLVDQYKKTILTQQRAYKDLAEKWIEASPKTGKRLVFAY